ncbi:hypothetical protein K9O30_06155 [Clostridium bowmanii]|nr:hypothetical protein [Clostridium bowmanii]
MIDPELKNLVLEFEETEFFRARVNNESAEDFSKEQMFHIPFQLRTKVTTQRYSFPGLPCLYLGASPYVCWLEMNRPSYDSLNVARIEKVSNKNIKVLDLNRTPTSIKAEYTNNSNDEFIINYLKIWPLIAVCSICVFDEVGSFKPEYIIPQMLLQWLITEDNTSRMSYNVRGIKYFSVKSNSEGRTTNQLRLNYPRMYTNYVFPIKKSKRSGLCSDLQNLFNISSSISGRTLQLVIPQRGIGLFTGTKQPEENMDLEKIVLHDGRTTLYSQSAFYWFEKVLREPSQITVMDGDVFLKYT